MPIISTGANVLSSDQIADGIIQNADIAAAAAIAYSKLALSGAVQLSDLEAAGVVTAAETIASNNNDTTLPTSAAVKSYADGILVPSLVDSGATASITNSLTETTLCTISIPAGELSTGNALKLTVLAAMDDQDNALATTFRLKYGSTTLATATTTGSYNYKTNGNPFKLECMLAAAGATGSQRGSLLACTDDNGVINADYDGGTASEDSTGALNLVVTAQLSNDSNSRLLAGRYILERISA